MGLPREKKFSNSLVSPEIWGEEGGVEYVIPRAAKDLLRISRGIN